MKFNDLSLDRREHLNTVSSEWTDFSSIGPAKKLEKRMVKIMRKNGGIGLAANQIGLDKRVFVMVMPNGKAMAIFNPVIHEYSNEMTYLEEGCLSFPNEFLRINRPDVIRASFFESNGRKKENIMLRGKYAKCFQHELDHLNGITYHARVDTAP